MWLGVACLFVVSGVALALWALGAWLTWTASYDKARSAQISKVIAADPQHLCGRRLDDVIRELRLEDIPWDDGNVQNWAGSLRFYHFRGFALWLTLDYMREGVTEDMMLERGSAEEKLRGRDLLRTNLHTPPSVVIDGISTREERMRRYRAKVDKEIEAINRRMKMELESGEFYRRKR